MKKIYFKYFILIKLIILSFLLICVNILIYNKTFISLSSLEKIKKAGALRIITNNSLASYYYDEGKPAGFEYDLSQAFADYLGVELDIVTPGWNRMFSFLENDQGDLIASGIKITEQRLEKVSFSIPYMNIQQHIIYHKSIPDPEKIEDLEKKTIHIRRGTSYQSKLESLKDSGIDIHYVLHNNMPTEQLISMVHNKKIEYTIADSRIAKLARRYYPDIKVGMPLHSKESLAWAVKKNNRFLLEQINKFILYATEKGLLQQLYDKYFANADTLDSFGIKKFHQRIKTRLPKYKQTLIKESEKYYLDWRLSAALMYQESHFNPFAKSFTNVKGLMQVTKITAREMGIKNRLNPEQSIKAGIKYFDKMLKKFDSFEDDYQKTMFALASYNIGYGHVVDAMKIVKNMGKDEKQWQNLKSGLLLLSKSKYYKKTKYGYARGREAVKFAKHVVTYFDILKKTIKTENNGFEVSKY